MAEPYEKKTYLEVPRFLNRLLGLPFAQQSLMFNFFNHTMNAGIMQAKKEGKYDQGLTKIVGRSITRKVRSKEISRKTDSHFYRTPCRLRRKSSTAT